jgi:hypothetical protein
MSFANRLRHLALFLLALAPAAAPPALAATCVGIAANQLPPGTMGADGLPLGGAVSEWYQVTGQCTPAYTTVRIQLPTPRGLDATTAAPLGATLFANTSHTETVVHDPLTGLPVLEMHVTNHAAGGGGERLLVFATATWP